MSRYTHDYAAFSRLCLASDWMLAEMVRRAENVAEFARATAPVDETGPHPGRYRDSIRAEGVIKGAQSKSRDGYRAAGRVVADAPESLFVEFGTEHNPAHRTLGRALDAAKD